MGDPPPSRPPRRSLVSGSFNDSDHFCAFMKARQVTSGATRPFIRNRISWSITHEPRPGEEVAKLCSLLRRGQGARRGAFAEYWTRTQPSQTARDPSRTSAGRKSKAECVPFLARRPVAKWKMVVG